MRAGLALALVLMGVCALGFAAKPLLGEPFEHGWLGRNGARYSLAAHNLLRWPLAVTGAVPCLAAGALDPREGPLPYARHPPGLTWMVAASFACFGEREDAARAIPWVATLLSAFVLFALASRRGSTAAGGAAMLAFCVFPMTLYYGGHVDVQGAPTTLAILLTVLFVTRSLERGQPRMLWLAGGCLSVGMWLDWPAYLCAALLAAHAFRVRAPARGLAWLGLGALHFAAFVLWISLAPPGGLDRLWAAVHERSLGGQDVVVDWSSRIGAWFRGLLALLPVGVVGIAAVLRPWRSRPVRSPPSFPAGPLLFATGLLHVLLFPAGALLHDYWAYLLAPPLALLVGRVVEDWDSALRAPWVRRIAAVLLLLGLSGAALAGLREVHARLLDEREAIHPYLARATRDVTAPEARILTNADYNPWAGQRLTHPAFSYYSARNIRGGIRSRADLDAAADWGATDFLLVPRHPVDADLREYLEEEAEGWELELGLWIYRLVP